MAFLNEFFFGIYPYICITVFLFGSLVRFDYAQYSWKSESSELLHRGQLRLGSNLFHIGIICVFFGHVAGLLTPLEIFHLLGITPPEKQMIAILSGGFFGTMAYIGLLILIHRRFTVDRINKNSTWRDKLVLIWLLITMTFGLSLVPLAAIYHRDGAEMLDMMQYVQHLVTFRLDLSYLENVSIVAKIHFVLGFSFFAIFPFTRMVHVWSGLGVLAYVPRAWQLVRRR